MTKKEPKEIKKQKPEEVKPKNVKTSFYILIDRRKENAFRSQWN